MKSMKSVRFMEIFYKSLTRNPSVYGTTVPLYRDSTVYSSENIFHELISVDLL